MFKSGKLNINCVGCIFYVDMPKQNMVRKQNTNRDERGSSVIRSFSCMLKVLSSNPGSGACISMHENASLKSFAWMTLKNMPTSRGDLCARDSPLYRLMTLSIVTRLQGRSFCKFWSVHRTPAYNPRQRV